MTAIHRSVDRDLRNLGGILHATTRRTRALLPDLCRGLGVAILAVMVMSILAAIAFQPFMHA